MLDTNSELNTLQRILDDIQATDITVIDVREQTSITDYMVICSGRSSRHVRAIGEYVIEEMKHAGYPSLGSTGMENGEWVLIDLGDLIVHILQPSARDFYNLEALWQTNPKP